MKFTNRSINAQGLTEIHNFLGKYHKRGRDHFTLPMLQAWAQDAEFQLSEGNPADIEIRAWDSQSGATVCYTISSAGIDSVDVENDD